MCAFLPSSTSGPQYELQVLALVRHLVLQASIIWLCQDCMLLVSVVGTGRPGKSRPKVHRGPPGAVRGAAS